MTYISKYVSLAEATKSQTAERLGITNIPTSAEIANMQHVAQNIFDKVREFVGRMLFVSSFFRCPALNVAIGGSATSQHRFGEAIDIDADPYGGKTNKEIFDYIRTNLEFDQLIWEFGTKANPAWVHVSLKKTGKNRREVLRAYTVEGRTRYVPFDLY